MNEMEKGDLSDIQAALTRLEERVSRIERALGLSTAGRSEARKEKASAAPQHEEMELEFKIGEFWFSRVGAIFLMIGAGFFISYPLPGFPPVVVSLLGFASVGVLFFLARYWKNTFAQLSRLVYSGSLILLFYATVHLHYFASQPIVSARFPGVVLTLIVLGLELFVVMRRHDPLFYGVVLLLIAVAALIISIPFISLFLISGCGALAASSVIRRDWYGVGFLGMVTTFVAHSLWLVGSPFGTLVAAQAHSFNLLFLLVYGALFGLVNVFRKEELAEFYQIFFTIVNGFGIMAVGAINVLKFFKSDLALLSLLTFGLFSLLAVLNKKFESKPYSSSFYANFGFVSLSIAIFAQFSFPDYFVWFGLQSLLVIVVALWFRSQIIVIANVLIFLFIFVLYLFLSHSNGFVNLSYAIAALASARLLNWKKDRLYLKTDKIRNLYLACAFVIILFGLFHAVPAAYVSLAWTGAAIGYFGLSLLLKNLKYRYLAILTIFATIIHVFFVDLRTVQAGFRIILFIAIGLVILILSLLYSSYHKRMNKNY